MADHQLVQSSRHYAAKIEQSKTAISGLLSQIEHHKKLIEENGQAKKAVDDAFAKLPKAAQPAAAAK